MIFSLFPLSDVAGSETAWFLVHTVRMCRKQADRRTWHGMARQGKARPAVQRPRCGREIYFVWETFYFVCFVYGEVLKCLAFYLVVLLKIC